MNTSRKILRIKRWMRDPAKKLQPNGSSGIEQAVRIDILTSMTKTATQTGHKNDKNHSKTRFMREFVCCDIYKTKVHQSTVFAHELFAKVAMSAADVATAPTNDSTKALSSEKKESPVNLICLMESKSRSTRLS